jgi:hypothetical protein
MEVLWHGSIFNNIIVARLPRNYRLEMVIFEFDANFVSFGSKDPPIELDILGPEVVSSGCLNWSAFSR